MHLQEVDRSLGMDGSGSEQGHGTGCCECGNEPSGSVKYREFF